MSEYKKLKLFYLNIKKTYSEIKGQIEYKKKIVTDRLIQKDSGYEDLTPESNIKNGSEYIKALHWGLKNRKVKNIALTGPYGSGKSSIIKSYLNKYPSSKALNISLATFDWNKDDNDNFENEIELGILKQLFYKVDSRRIPQSRYRKIRKSYYRKYLLVTCGIVLIVLAAFSFFFPENFNTCVDKIIESGSYYNINGRWSKIIASLFGVIGIFIISYMAKWGISHFKIREVNIVDKAVISSEKNEESIFDRCMDEIVYFFEETNYDIVFIEDLDRFESTEIFVKLRELNTILNNYDLIRKRIVFVYAVKDDMFQYTERTKFFDFIIPVIPIINSTNSGEILREKLKIEMQEDGDYKSSLYDISSSFITLVSPFIEDMRILINICNEFIIYKNTQKSIRLKDEEMFSLIMFKNLYPRDFADLESEKGIIKRAFLEKKNFISFKQSQLEEENAHYKDILNGIEQDILNDVKELKAAFLNFLVGGDSTFNYCSIEGRNYHGYQIMQDDFDMSIFDSATRVHVNSHISGTKVINDLQVEILQSGRNYLKRLHNLKNNEETRKEEIREKIKNNEIDLTNLHTISLKEMIEKFGGDEIFSSEVKENKVLVFLLRKGFINENYTDYINYFHPNSITKDEMNYIRGIRMQEAAGDFSYSIKNVAQVCERIEDYEFKQVEALNFDVLDYLLTTNPSDNKCIELFKGLASNNKVSNNFIREYIERKQNIEIFIKLICKWDRHFWKDIVNNELITQEIKYQYLILILNYAEFNDIIFMNTIDKTEWIKDFVIDRKQSLVKLSNVDSNRMIQLIEELDIKFTDIEVIGANDVVLNYIFENNKYVLNQNMLNNLFQFKFDEKIEQLVLSNYSIILEVSFEPLLNHIYQDFEYYVSEFVVGQETNNYEKIEAVEDILERLHRNNTELCLSLLDKENVLWNELNKCCICEEKADGEEQKEIWNRVLKNRMVSPSWNNFLDYYNAYSITANLIEWVDDVVDSLIQEQRPEQITDKIIKELITDNVSYNTFEKIIDVYKLEDFDISLTEFDAERISLMIKKEYIPFTIEFLGEIKQEAPEYIAEYILKNKIDFFGNIEEVLLDIETIVDLLKTGKFVNDEIKILISLFEPEDMNTEMAGEIRKLEICIDKSYVESAWLLLEEKDRYQLLLNQIDVYSLDEIAKKFSELAPVYKNLADRNRRHREYLPVDEYGYNKRLLDILKKRKYITSVQQEEYEEYNSVTNTKEVRKRFVVWIKQK